MEKFRIDNIIEDYHGTKIADPFRYLENPEDKDTQNFIKTQNDRTREFIDACDKLDSYKKRIQELWDYEKFSAPKKYGDFYYYQYNDGLSNQPLFLRTKKLLINPS